MKTFTYSTVGNSKTAIKLDIDNQAESRKQRELTSAFWGAVRRGLEPEFVEQLSRTET